MKQNEYTSPDVRIQEMKDIRTLGRQMYIPASVKVIEVTAQGIICQSGGINRMTIDEEDGGEMFN